MPDKNGKDEKITIITPDGNKMSGTRKELENLKVLGDYREESTKELSDRQIEKQREKDYTTTGHKVGTFIAGAASGASLGLLEDRNNPEEAGLDAKYNPGTRLAGEIVGGALGSFAPVTPAGQVSKLAGRASTAVGGGFKGALAAGAIEGAGAGLQAETSNATLSGTPLDIESVLGGIGTGAIFGAGLNAGIHGLGTGASKLGNKLEPVKPPDTYAPKAKDLGEIELVTPEKYDAFRQNVADTKPSREYVDDYINAIDSDMVKMKADHAAAISSADESISRLSKDLKTAQSDITAAESEYESYIKKRGKLSEKAVDINAKDKAAGGLLAPFQELDKSYVKVRDKVSTLIDTNPELNELSKIVTESKSEFQAALKAGNYKAASDALEFYNKAAQAFRTKASTIPGAPKLGHIKFPKLEKAIREPAVADLSADYEAKITAARSRAEQLNRELVDTQTMRAKFPELDFTHHLASKEDFGKIGAALDDIKNFPTTAKEFQGMGTAKLNRLADSLDVVIKSANKIESLAPVVASLEKATQSLVESTGIKAEGGIIQQLKAIQKIAKEANKQKILGPIEHEILNIKPGKTGSKAAGMFGDYGAAMAASSVSKAVGVGGMGYFGIKHAILNGVDGLAGIKTAVQTKISKAAKAVGKTFQSTRKNYVVPKLQPLYTKLNGERDKDAKNAREAARNRINELMEMAPIAPDVLFKGLEPLSGNVHNEFFGGLHAAAVNSYNALIEMLPKDKFGTQVGFRNVWEPNDVETALTAKILDAYYDPVLTMEEAMKGNLDVTQIEVIKNCYPEMYQHMRGMVMQQVAENPTMTNTYQKQAALSHLLDIPVSSAFDPKNIIEGQSMFVNTPSVSNPNQGGGTRSNKGGAPPKTEPATAGQMNVMRE